MPYLYSFESYNFISLEQVEKLNTQRLLSYFKKKIRPLFYQIKHDREFYEEYGKEFPKDLENFHKIEKIF